MLALVLAGCAGIGERGEAVAPREEKYSQPRNVVWEAAKGVLEEQHYDVLEEYRARGVMNTDWQFETKDDLAYRSRVNAWVSGTGPYRVEFEVQMYVRAITAPTDVRMESAERARTDELYRALRKRLTG